MARKFAQIAPYLVVTGSEKNPKQIFLSAEQTIFFEVESSMACPAALLALFYVLNTNYPQSCSQFYCCLEALVLGNTSGKVTPAISEFLRALK
jgi:hypothetical protein